MNFASFKSRLQREAKKNPKQAVVLGLLLLIAVYYWSPLILGFFSSGTQPVAQTPAINDSSAENDLSTEDSSEPEGKTAKQKLPHWKELTAWMQADPLMQAKIISPIARDPFVEPVELVEEEPDKQEKPQIVAPDLPKTPAELGIVVTSTIVGPQRRVALINGRAYAEGKTVTTNSGSETVAFRIAQVHPRHIVLEREGQQFDLKIRNNRFTEVSGFE